jgi:SAM-dependent methyltransferase
MRACWCSGAPVLMDWPWGSRAAYEALYRDDLAYHEGEMAATSRCSFWTRDAEYLRVACLRLREYRARYPKARTLLDMGAANGAVPALAGAFDFDAVGYEVNAAMAVRARSLGREVRPGDCLALKSGQWDLVTLHDVLEHLLEPVAALLALRERVADGGRLIIEMPLLPCYAIEWPTFRHRKPREHPFLYSQGAALKLFEKAGLACDHLHLPRNGAIGKAAYHLRRD